MALLILAAISLSYLVIGPVGLLVIVTADGPKHANIMEIGSILAGIVSGGSSLFIIRGAWRMRKLTHYRQAKLAAILACIPILTPGIINGIPFGLWAVLVLTRPSIRELFES